MDLRHTRTKWRMYLHRAGEKPIPGTWYIQLDKLLATPGALEKYKQLVSSSDHEIGLHGVSATANHIKWFPSVDKNPAYQTVDEAIDRIVKFRNYLSERAWLQGAGGSCALGKLNQKEISLARLRPADSWNSRQRTLRFHSTSKTRRLETVNALACPLFDGCSGARPTRSGAGR
jgi:hypothetical protein